MSKAQRDICFQVFLWIPWMSGLLTQFEVLEGDNVIYKSEYLSTKG